MCDKMAEIFREYHRTHDWITFKFDVTKLSKKAWLQLGKVKATCEYISGMPLAPDVAQLMYRIYLAKGVHATTAIEGNSFTEEEVRKVIESDIDVPPSKEYQKKEIKNIQNAMNYIANNILNNHSPTELNTSNIKTYHEKILNELDNDSRVEPGHYRQDNVVVTGAGYRGAPVQDVPLLMQQMCDWLNSWDSDLGDKNTEYLKAPMGILKAIIAHIYLAWIHPFADGNGRTARLIELQILLGIGLPMPTCHLLSNHYNETRTEYYHYLDMTSKHDYGIYYFVEYALQGFVDALDSQVEYIQGQQMIVQWKSYVYDKFKNKDGVTKTRQRKLVLDLTDKVEPVPLAEIRYVSARIAEAYANKTDRTVRRDIGDLTKMELVVKTDEGYVVNTGSMRAFLPMKRKQD